MPLEDNSVRFTLSYESNNECKNYTLLTFARSAKQGKSVKEGTGLRYIKARLIESYHSKWDLISEPTDHGWKSVIRIYA